MMHNYCKTIGALAAVSALVAGKASAEVEYELHTGYSSEYLFRGINLGQGLVEAGADVRGEVGGGVGLSAGAWYGSIQNGRMSGPNDASFDEIDLYAQVSKDWGFLTTAVGYIYRQFPNSAYAKVNCDDSQEVYFSISRQITGTGIDLSLTYYQGIEGDNDGYTEFDIKKGFELCPCVTLNTGAKLGYLVQEGDFTHLANKISVDWGFAQHAKLSPFIEYDVSLSEGGRMYRGVLANYRQAKNQIIGGVMLSVGF